MSEHYTPEEHEQAFELYITDQIQMNVLPTRYKKWEELEDEIRQTYLEEARKLLLEETTVHRE